MTNVYRQVVLADGPVAVWPLDEAAGPVIADASGNGHDGTPSGVLTYSQPTLVPSDTAGNSIIFPNNQRYIDVPDSPAFDVQEFTVEMWVSGVGGAGQRQGYLIGATAPVIEIWIGGGGNGNLVVWDTGGTSHLISGWPGLSTFPDATRVHIVLTYKGSTGAWAIYKNGAVALSGTAAYTLRGPTGPFRFGSLGGNSTGHGLDWVSFYNKVLTVAQVDVHYQAGMGTYTPPPDTGLFDDFGVAPPNPGLFTPKHLVRWASDALPTVVDSARRNAFHYPRYADDSLAAVTDSAVGNIAVSASYFYAVVQLNYDYEHTFVYPAGVAPNDMVFVLYNNWHGWGLHEDTGWVPVYYPNQNNVVGYKKVTTQVPGDTEIITIHGQGYRAASAVAIVRGVDTVNPVTQFSLSGSSITATSTSKLALYLGAQGTGGGDPTYARGTQRAHAFDGLLGAVVNSEVLTAGQTVTPVVSTGFGGALLLKNAG